MLVSDAVNITFEGRPAQIYVMRNSGYCFGRLVIKGRKTEFNIFTDRDYYEYDDETAAAAFERAVKRGRVELVKANSFAQGWTKS